MPLSKLQLTRAGSHNYFAYHESKNLKVELFKISVKHLLSWLNGRQKWQFSESRENYAILKRQCLWGTFLESYLDDKTFNPSEKTKPNLVQKQKLWIQFTAWHKINVTFWYLYKTAALWKSFVYFASHGNLWKWEHFYLYFSNT